MHQCRNLQREIYSLAPSEITRTKGDVIKSLDAIPTTHKSENTFLKDSAQVPKKKKTVFLFYLMQLLIIFNMTMDFFIALFFKNIFFLLL